MASSSRSILRRFSLGPLGPLGGALVAGLAISSASPSALAQPAPVAPAAIAPAPPPYGAEPLGRAGGASGYQVPTYVYLPGAGTPGSPGFPDVPTKRGWYGWQTLLVFGGSATIGIVGAVAGGASDSPGVWITSLGIGGTGFLLGGPIVHWLHGNTSKGFGALGLNFGVPLVGGGLGIATACIVGGCGRSSDGIGIFVGLLVGGSAGLLASMIIDVSALSYEQTPSGPSFASRKAPTWTILPDLKITREKTTFGFSGVF